MALKTVRDTAGPTPAGSFSLDGGPEHRRLIMDVHGLERHGKTHFALTAPGPIGYMQLDPGGIDVVPKLRRLYPRKAIYQASYFPDLTPGLGTNEVERIAKPVWDRFAADYEQNLPILRTLIVDTGSEAWELLRLAEFGKTTSVKPIHYGSTNAVFRRLIRIAYNYPCNVIWLHKMKRTYKDDKWNGEMERAGFGGLGYEVQIQARAFRDEDGFQLAIEDCRQNPDLAGEVITQEMLTFPIVASLVYPETTPADWE